VVVISDALVQRLWPNGDALGQTIRLGGASDRATRADDAPQNSVQLYTVIGALNVFGFTYSGIYLP